MSIKCIKYFQVQGSTRMKKMINSIKSKKTFVGGILLLALFSSTFLLNNTASNIQNVNNLKMGLRTCFQRVMQTYTAKIIGDSSAIYLDKSFHADTEECFSEMISMFEYVIGVENDIVLKRINTLSSDVHWFHDKVFSMKDDNKQLSLSYLGERFSSSEELKNNISMNLDQEIYSNERLQSVIKYLLLMIAVLTGFVIWSNVLQKYSIDKKCRNIEDRAGTCVDIESGDYEIEQAEDIIEQALLTNEMNKSYNLFQSYQKGKLEKSNQRPWDQNENNPLAEMIEEITPADNSEISDVIQTEGVDTIGESIILADDLDQQTKQDQINSVWNVNEEKRIIEQELSTSNFINATDIADVMTKLSKSFQNKFIVKSILFNFDVTNDLQFVAGDTEKIELIFHQLILSCIKSFPETMENKEIKIKVVQGEDKKIEIHFIDNGLILDNTNLDIIIAKEILEEIGGKLLLETVRDENNEIVRVVKTVVVFSATLKVKDSPLRLISYKKGKKKDLLRELEAVL